MDELKRHNEELVATIAEQDRELAQLQARTDAINAATALRRAELEELRAERARREQQARNVDAKATPAAAVKATPVAAAVSGHSDTNDAANEDENVGETEKDATEKCVLKDAKKGD